MIDQMTIYRVWPDGTVQEVDEAPHSHMSDDFLLVPALDECEAARFGNPPAAAPAHKINAAGTVAVSTEVFIDPDMSTCPRGVKVQLEGKGGILLYGIYDGKDPFYVGWAPLPRRRPK